MLLSYLISKQTSQEVVTMRHPIPTKQTIDFFLICPPAYYYRPPLGDKLHEDTIIIEDVNLRPNVAFDSSRGLTEVLKQELFLKTLTIILY